MRGAIERSKGKGGSELCGYLEHYCLRFGGNKVQSPDLSRSILGGFRNSTEARIWDARGDAVREARDGPRHGSCGGLWTPGRVSLLLRGR